MRLLSQVHGDDSNEGIYYESNKCVITEVTNKVATKKMASGLS